MGGLGGGGLGGGGSTEAIVGRVRRRLLEAEAGLEVESLVALLVAEEAPLVGHGARAEMVAAVLAEVCGLGPLEALVADPDITEIMLNGPGPVWIERCGELHCLDLVLAAEEISRLIERVVGPLGLRVDRSSPYVDARLADGSRVHAIVPPLAIDGPYLTIRRFRSKAFALEDFTSCAVADLLRHAVATRANIVVSGGTGTGKTTFLNALAASIGPDERVVTVEDAAELALPGRHVVRLESRPPNAEGAGATTVRELVRNALRMRPDRIVVGEVRGPEALDMLQALNTGHEGSLSTCHANSPDDALARLETMVLMADLGLPLASVASQLHSAVDLIVQLGRAAAGRRQITQVAEVLSPAELSRNDLGTGRPRPLQRTRILARGPELVEPSQRVLGRVRP
ncbi:MAG: CpaF family protein [Acidimicrobiales bacterium]